MLKLPSWEALRVWVCTFGSGNNRRIILRRIDNHHQPPSMQVTAPTQAPTAGAAFSAVDDVTKSPKEFFQIPRRV